MSAFALSKPFVDVGLFTDDGGPAAAFYGDVLGLPALDTVPIEPGYTLYRYDAHGSALKLNVLDSPLPARRTCYSRMVWPEPGRRHTSSIEDPDGNVVELVPPGHLDIDQVGIVYRVPSPEAAHAFAVHALGARPLGPGRFRLGGTVLLFEIDPDAPRAGALESHGFTYITLHVTDTVAVHAWLVAHGCLEAIPPTPFEAITTYSFVRDPFGGWIEISQRADLAGGAPTPVVRGPHLHQDDVRAIRRRP